MAATREEQHLAKALRPLNVSMQIWVMAFILLKCNGLACALEFAEGTASRLKQKEEAAWCD